MKDMCQVQEFKIANEEPTAQVLFCQSSDNGMKLGFAIGHKIIKITTGISKKYCKSTGVK